MAAHRNCTKVSDRASSLLYCCRLWPGLFVAVASADLPGYEQAKPRSCQISNMDSNRARTLCRSLRRGGAGAKGKAARW